MTVGLEDYDIKQKNDWRGWAWNRIVERLPEFSHRPHFDVKRMNNQDRRILADKTVLYLCGPDDFDRRHAMRLGFSDKNCIAIDSDQACVNNVRLSRGLAVNGRLDELLVAWPQTWHVDAIVADLCCGLTRQAHAVMQSCLLSQGTSESTVLAINLQRGRDGYANNARDKLESSEDRAHMHRGKLFLTFLLGEHSKCGGAWSDPSYADAVNAMCPISRSYRASRVVMDSMVLRLGWKPPWSSIGSRYARTQALLNRTVDKSIYNRIGALRAVRTMKLNGELESN